MDTKPLTPCTVDLLHITSGTEKRVSNLSKKVPAHRRDSRRPNSLLAVPGGPMYSMCSCDRAASSSNRTYSTKRLSLSSKQATSYTSILLLQRQANECGYSGDGAKDHWTQCWGSNGKFLSLLYSQSLYLSIALYQSFLHDLNCSM